MIQVVRYSVHIVIRSSIVDLLIDVRNDFPIDSFRVFLRDPLVLWILDFMGSGIGSVFRNDDGVEVGMVQEVIDGIGNLIGYQ